VLTNGARERLCHPAVRQVFVTDSVPQGHAAWPELKIVTIAPLLAAAMRRLHTHESMADLYTRSIGPPAATFSPQILAPEMKGEPHEPSLC
jgi:ribose-phosphate pyrophosphokinase